MCEVITMECRDLLMRLNEKRDSLVRDLDD